MGSSSGRRVWSAEQKRWILEEALVPGASVAEVARRYEVNANLLFKWLRRVGQGRQVKRTKPVADAAGEPGEFVPLGVVTRDAMTGGAVLRLPAPGSERPLVPVVPAPAAAKPEKRLGLIEIDLPGGGRVRIDAFVNERTLGCVLRALKDRA